MKKILYHGTSAEFDGNNIDLSASSRPKDFGNGFYLTSICSQAEKWASRNKKYNKSNHEIIKKYEYEEKLGSGVLNILLLNEYNEEWLEYIIKNRNSMDNTTDNYDLVIGLMADGHIKELMKDYISDFITKEELLDELKFENENDQYTFKTEQSLRFLKFIEDTYK